MIAGPCWVRISQSVISFPVIAPHGIDDLVHMIVRPTPAFRTKMSVYEQRLASKVWARRWPQLTFLQKWPATEEPQ